MLKIRNVLILALLIFLFSASSLYSQSTSPLEPGNWNVVYEVPGMENVKVTRDIVYSKDAKGSLAIDVYLPPEAKAGEKRPAIIFLNGVGDLPNNKVKDKEIYKSWGRLVAAHNLVGINMDADGSRIQENFCSLFDFLTREGAKYGIDSSRLGVYAASANVTPSIQFLMDEKAAPGIRVAVMYYGFAVPDDKIRKDLPMMYLVAQGDLQGVGPAISSALWKQVTDNAAPWTLVFASRMPHAFDIYADNDESRRHILQTISFWKTHLEQPRQPNWKPSENRRILEAIYSNDPARAVELLAKYTAENPTDAQGFAQYARQLQQLRRSDEALAAFQKALAIQPNHPQSLNGIGQIYYGQKKYAEAADYLLKAIDSGFRPPFVYSILASSQLNLNRNEEAIKNYEKALELGMGLNARRSIYYNIGIAYLRLKQSDKAFEMLNKAVTEGFNSRAELEKDTDWAPVRTDARFQQILTRMNVNTNP